MEKTKELELTVDELVQLLKIAGDGTLINVEFEVEGGDKDGRREAVRA